MLPPDFCDLTRRENLAVLREIFGTVALGMMGFKSETPPPPCRSCVLIAAPHTTNWDLPVMLWLSFIMGMRISYLAKHTICRNDNRGSVGISQIEG